MGSQNIIDAVTRIAKRVVWALQHCNKLVRLLVKVKKKLLWMLLSWR